MVIVAGVVLSLIGNPAAANLTPRLMENRAEFSYIRQVNGLVQAINAVRAEQQLRPVRLETKLSQASQWMAADMATRETVSHVDSWNHGTAQRVTRFELRDYFSIRENLAGGMVTPGEVVRAWMESPSHREALLDRRMREVGVGYVYRASTAHRHYWAISLGNPKPR